MPARASPALRLRHCLKPPLGNRHQHHPTPGPRSAQPDLLRNPQLQERMQHSDRAKRTFLVGYEVKDAVDSETLFTEGEDHAMKPEDYLRAFERFVREKGLEIEAIAILRNRPRKWNTQALNELRQKLIENYFPEHELRKAHKIVYQKELVDIISMVKHAARESEPLLSPEERLAQAIQNIVA